MTVKELIERLSQADPESMVAVNVYGHEWTPAHGGLMRVGEIEGAYYSPAKRVVKIFAGASKGPNLGRIVKFLGDE